MSTGTSETTGRFTVSHDDLLRLGACDQWADKWKRRYKEEAVTITAENLIPIMRASYPISWFIGAAFGDVPDEMDRRHARLITRALLTETRYLAVRHGIEDRWDNAARQMDEKADDTYIDLEMPSLVEVTQNALLLHDTMMEAVCQQGNLGGAFEGVDDVILTGQIGPKSLPLTRRAMAAYFDEAADWLREYIDGCDNPY